VSSVRPDRRVPVVAATAALSLFALQRIIRYKIFVSADRRVPVAATAALSLFALQIIIRCQIFVSSVRPDRRVPVVAATAALSLFEVQIIIKCQIFVSSVRRDRTKINVTSAPIRPANCNKILCKKENFQSPNLAYISLLGDFLTLKGLSHEIDFKNFDHNLKNLT
jgi:hypothetical protein